MDLIWLELDLLVDTAHTLPQCCPHPGLFIKLGAEIRFLYPNHSAGTWVHSREEGFTGLVDADFTQHFDNIHPN